MTRITILVVCENPAIMPVKHGPKNVPGQVTVDLTCLEPGCNQEAMPGKAMCRDHEPTDEMPAAPPRGDDED